MKKIYLTIAMFAGVIQAFAQIQIVRSDLGQVGDKLYLATIDTFATQVNVGAAGANKTWNFSTLVPTAYDSSLFVDPTTIWDAPLSANLAIVSGNEATEFLNVDPTGIIIIQTNEFSGEEIITDKIPFPFTYQTAYTDTIEFSITGTPDELGIPLPVDSVRITANVIAILNFDAWGTLTLHNSVNDVLRRKDIIYTDISIEGNTFGTWLPIFNQVDTGYTYTWYGKNKKYFLAEADADKDGKISFLTYQVDAVFPNSIKETLANGSYTISPNPANEVINIELKDAQSFTYFITDITGRTITSGKSMSASTQVNSSSLKSGLYTITIQNGDAAASKKIFIQH
jgi:hypothetical protein